MSQLSCLRSFEATKRPPQAFDAAASEEFLLLLSMNINEQEWNYLFFAVDCVGLSSQIIFSPCQSTRQSEQQRCDFVNFFNMEFVFGQLIRLGFGFNQLSNLNKNYYGN